jgi:prolipoprotein diacylglyceryltransferase
MAETVVVDGRAFDPDKVTGVRTGNALWPGLTLFTGLSFAVYLAVKLATGALPMTAGGLAQFVVAVLLMTAGGWSILRARYFYVVVETQDGPTKIGGLTKGERDLAAKMLQGGA